MSLPPQLPHSLRFTDGETGSEMLKDLSKVSVKRTQGQEVILDSIPRMEIFHPYTVLFATDGSHLGI